MSWSRDSVPDNVAELKTDLAYTWVEVANKALEQGYDEDQATAIAWSVINRMQSYEYAEMPAIYWQYPLSRIGNYVADVGGEFEITSPIISELHEAITTLYGLGKPVALVDGHGSALEFGLIPAALVDGDDVLRGCLVYDTWYDVGIRSGVYSFSIEGKFNYSSEAYTKGKEFAIWPFAWAMVPAGSQPAMPPGEPLEVAASEDKRKVRLFAQAPVGAIEPDTKGADEVKLEERVDALELKLKESETDLATLRAENEELKGKLTAAETERDGLKTAKEAEEAKAAEAEIAETTKTVMARALPGRREAMETDLKACDSIDGKRAMLSAWDKALPTKLAAAEGENLHAGDEDPDAEPETADLKAANKDIAEAKKLMASEKISYSEAIKRVDERKGE